MVASWAGTLLVAILFCAVLNIGTSWRTVLAFAVAYLWGYLDAKLFDYHDA